MIRIVIPGVFLCSRVFQFLASQSLQALGFVVGFWNTLNRKTLSSTLLKSPIEPLKLISRFRLIDPLQEEPQGVMVVAPAGGYKAAQAGAQLGFPGKPTMAIDQGLGFRVQGLGLSLSASLDFSVACVLCVASLCAVGPRCLETLELA